MDYVPFDERQNKYYDSLREQEAERVAQLAREKSVDQQITYDIGNGLEKLKEAQSLGTIALTHLEHLKIFERTLRDSLRGAPIPKSLFRGKEYANDSELIGEGYYHIGAVSLGIKFEWLFKYDANTDRDLSADWRTGYAPRVCDLNGQIWKYVAPINANGNDVVGVTSLSYSRYSRMDTEKRNKLLSAINNKLNSNTSN